LKKIQLNGNFLKIKPFKGNFYDEYLYVSKKLRERLIWTEMPFKGFFYDEYIYVSKKLREQLIWTKMPFKGFFCNECTKN